MAAKSEHLSERKIDAISASQRMLPVLKRSDTVIDKACGTAPHRDVTAFEAQTAHGIGAAFAAPQKYGGQAKRDGDDRSPGIFLVTVLMETEFGARDVAVDQASVRIVVGEAGLSSGAYGDVEESRGHRGPRPSGAGIHRVVAVAGAVGDPTEAPAVGHRDRHGMTAV